MDRENRQNSLARDQPVIRRTRQVLNNQQAYDPAHLTFAASLLYIAGRIRQWPRPWVTCGGGK